MNHISPPVALVLSKLPDAKRSGGGWGARCPAHEDRNPSLSISTGADGRALVHCHRGCTIEAICEAMEIAVADLMADDPLRSSKPCIARTYDYCDEAGTVLFQVVRFQPKDFRQRKPDGAGGWDWSVKGVRIVPYRLKQLLESRCTAVVVEGEKDVEALEAIGVTATCNAGGSGKWTAEHAKHLARRDVVILPDNDEPGRSHARQVAASLAGISASIRIVALPGVPDKGDASDWIAAGGTKDKLRELALAAAPWSVDEQLPVAESVDGPKIVTLESAARGYLASLKDNRTSTIDLGIPDVDYAIGGGVELGEMIILAARPSHGKSAVALQVIHNATANAMPCCLVSEEMSALALGKRAIQFASGVPAEYWATDNARVSGDLDGHFKSRAPCYVVEACRTPERASDVIRRAVEHDGVKVAVVDYAQLLSGQGKGRYEQVTNTSIALRQLASRCQIVLLVLCQLSREIEKRTKFVPNMADLKDSGQLEQDADVVLFLCWPHRLDAKRDPKEFLIFVAKNRNRPINQATVKCQFRPARQMLVVEPRGQSCDEAGLPAMGESF